MSLIRDTFSNILDYATDRPGLSTEDIKKIRMTNIACGVQAINLMSLFITVLVYRIYLFLPILAFELAGLLACLIFEKRGRYTLAKTMLYLPILFAVTIACAGFEESFQVIVYGFPLTTALFLLYGRKEAHVMYSLVIISFFSLVGGNLTAGLIAPFFIIPDSPFLAYFPAVTSSQALFLSALICKGFFDESYRSEQKHIEAARIISEQKERLQAVFDIVEEAILTVDERGRIQSGFSQHTAAVLARDPDDIVGQNAFDIFISAANHDRDELDQCRAALEMSLGSHELLWHANEDKILRELSYIRGGQQLTLVLNWQPIVRQEMIVGLLLMARDITIHRIHDQIREDQLERTQMLMGVVAAIMKSNRSVVENYLSRGLDRLKLLDPQDTKSTLFELHTLKGVARSLDLRDIAQRLHVVETAIHSNQVGDLRGRIQGLYFHFHSTLSLVHDMVGPGSDSYAIALHNLYDVASHSLTNIYGLLEKHQLELAAFHVEDNVLGWNPSALEHVHEALLHAITNSIDHGFVFPRQRQEKVEPKIQLSLRSWAEERTVIIEFRDNGCGIDDATLERLARRYELDLKNYENPLDILFEAGISSTNHVSLTSGRGVGTSAIRSSVAKIQGTASLHRQEPRGLLLRLVLPKESTLYSTKSVVLRPGQQIA